MEQEKKKKTGAYDVAMVLGAVWVIVGLIVYPNPAVWPLGFIFLLVGLAGKYGNRPRRY